MKVDVIIPTYRGVNPQTWPLITRMINRTQAEGVDVFIPPVHASALVHKTRNMALNLIREDTDFVLFCDDDMGPASDSLLKLLAHDVPVVSAFTSTRGEFPPKIAAKEYIEEGDYFNQIMDMKRNKLIKGKFALGTGFLLLKREVIEQAREYYLSANDWLEDNRRTMDRMHVRKEQREAERARKEAIRRDLWQSEKHHRTFQFMVLDNEMECGEDTAFGRNLIRMGIDTYIDTGCVVAHFDWYPYSPYNLHDKSVEDGVKGVAA